MGIMPDVIIYIHLFFSQNFQSRGIVNYMRGQPAEAIKDFKVMSCKLI